MRKILAACAAIIPSLLFAQPADDSVDALVRKLASATFAQRQAATEALKKRPEAAPALRDAMRSADLETQRRAAEILEYYEQEPVIKLHAAAESGRVEDVIKILVAWPTGKLEDEAWREFDAFAMRLARLSREKGKTKITLWGPDEEKDFELALPVPVYVGATITDATRYPDYRGFLRVGKVDYRQNGGEDGKTHNRLADAFAVVATGSVRTALRPTRQAVFAGGSLETLQSKTSTCNSVLVCCGDATLRSSLYECLVVARGKVTCTAPIENCQFISGKSVTVKGEPKNCRIIENESNPLGYIRWSDAPNEKAPAKGK